MTIFTRLRRALVIGVCYLALVGVPGCASRGVFDGSVATRRPTDHRVLVTADAAYLESELNRVAADGFRLHAVHSTLVPDRQRAISMANVTVARNAAPGRFSYRVVARSWPAAPFTTDDDEIDRFASALTEVLHGPVRVATEEGFHYPGQAMVLTGEADLEGDGAVVVFDGVMVVLERDSELSKPRVGETALSTVRVLATRRASTMEREINEAAEAGCRLQAVESTFSEALAFLECDEGRRHLDYRVFLGNVVRPRVRRFDLLDIETNAEETAQALNAAASDGFVYRAHAASPSGGVLAGRFLNVTDFMVFLERDREAPDNDMSVRHLVFGADPGALALEHALAEASTFGYTVLGIASGHVLGIGDAGASVILAAPSRADN